MGNGRRVILSDQSILSASWACEQLGLPGQPYDSVKILQNKALFRDFLRNNGFNCPKSRGYNDRELAIKESEGFNTPFLVKPVD